MLKCFGLLNNSIIFGKPKWLTSLEIQIGNPKILNFKINIMKTKLLSTKKTTRLFSALTLCLCANFGYSQTNLVQNGTADEHTSSTSDNADSWDMTPNSEIKDESGTDVASPYRYEETTNPNGWYNSTLETYISDTYAGGNNPDEQPGSSSDGSYDGDIKTRSVKLYDDGDANPVVSVSTRRLYQKITVELGSEYTFSIDSRSEADGTPSDVFMLNEEITTEAGLENGAADSKVDAYLNITNDFTGDKTVFATNTFDFTASTTTVVIYVRSLLSINKDTEVYFDNISLIKKEATASVNSVLDNAFAVYPNPATDYITIDSGDFEVSSVELYNLLGKKVQEEKELNNNKLDVSNLTKGVYMLKINTEIGSLNKRVLID